MLPVRVVVFPLISMQMGMVLATVAAHALPVHVLAAAAHRAPGVQPDRYAKCKCSTALRRVSGDWARSLASGFIPGALARSQA